MHPVLLSLLPDFSLIVLGGLVRGILTREAWLGIDKLNYYLLFPSLVFTAALQRTPNADDLVVIGFGVWAIIGLGFVLGWLVRPLGPESFLDFAGMLQTAWRFNTALAFVAVQAFPPGYAPLVSIAVGFAIPLANILAVAVLSSSLVMSPLQTVWQILLNPFFVSSMLGISFSIASVTPPDLVLDPLRLLADAALPVALVSMGAALNWRAIARFDWFTAALNLIKLVVLPAATWSVAMLIGLDPARTAVLTMFAALPTSLAAHILASVFGAEREAVATVIAQSSLIGCVSLTAWLIVLA